MICSFQQIRLIRVIPVHQRRRDAKFGSRRSANRRFSLKKYCKTKIKTKLNDVSLTAFWFCNTFSESPEGAAAAEDLIPCLMRVPCALASLR